MVRFLLLLTKDTDCSDDTMISLHIYGTNFFRAMIMAFATFSFYNSR